MRGAAAIVAATVLFSAGVAAADPCEHVGPLPDGPVAAALRDGELGLARRACPRSEVGLAAHARLIVDREEGYGDVVSAARLSGSFALDERTELSASLEPVRWETVISSIRADTLGLGHLSIGAMRQVAAGEPWALGVTGRLVLPAAREEVQGHALALDAGLVAAWTPARALRLHGALLVLGSVGVGPGPAAPRAGAALTAGGAWVPLPRLAFLAELGLTLGYAAALEAFELRGAIRFAAGSRVGAELGVTVPVAGRERALLAAVLRLSVRLDVAE